VERGGGVCYFFSAAKKSGWGGKTKTRASGLEKKGGRWGKRATVFGELRRRERAWGGGGKGTGKVLKGKRLFFFVGTFFFFLEGVLRFFWKSQRPPRFSRKKRCRGLLSSKKHEVFSGKTGCAGGNPRRFSQGRKDGERSVAPGHHEGAVTRIPDWVDAGVWPLGGPGPGSSDPGGKNSLFFNFHVKGRRCAPRGVFSPTEIPHWLGGFRVVLWGGEHSFPRFGPVRSQGAD